MMKICIREELWNNFPAPRFELFSETQKTIIKTGETKNLKSLLQTNIPKIADKTIK